jgi:hypothetical protein
VTPTFRRKTLAALAAGATALTFALPALAQPKAGEPLKKLPKDSKIEAQIAALEQAGWTAWKHKDE